VRVIIPPWDDQQRAGDRWTEAGVEVFHTGLGPGPLQRPVVIWDMLQAIRSFRPDVVHAFKPIGYSGAIAHRLAGRPGRGTLVVVDTDDMEGPAGWAGRRGLGLAGRLRGAQERRTLRVASLVTVASSWLSDFAASLGVAPDRILRLPNGHSVRPSGAELPVPRAAGARRSESRVSRSARGLDSPDTRNPQLVWYTRFTEAAPDRAARLLAPLLRAHPELVLTVLGDELAPGDRGALEGALVREGVEPRVRWLGYEQATSEEYLLRASSTAIAIYPMDDDAVNRARCPSKIPQLMALGVPIVAEAVGEIPRYLAGFERECLTAPGDDVAYRERVEGLLADRSRRAILRRKLQRAADNWRWDNLAAGLLPWYEYALRGADTR
jgi:glycosyltransferase involved in cell wall biosynthesis